MGKELWLPGAERKQDHSGGTMLGGPPRVTAHITWDALKKDGSQPDFDAVAHYLLAQNFEPHFMVDVFSGRIVQFLPAHVSAYALKHVGSPATNGFGDVNIQVEIFFTPGMKRAGKTYHTVSETPMKGLDKIAAFAESWGVPIAWATKEPAWQGNDRSVSHWQQKKGWFGHCHVPENDHTDPGPLNLNVLHDRVHGTTSTTVKVPATPATHTDPKPAPATGVPAWWHRLLAVQTPLLKGDDVTVVQHKVGASSDGVYGDNTAKAVAVWQKKNGLAADGKVGKATATKMGK